MGGPHNIGIRDLLYYMSFSLSFVFWLTTAGIEPDKHLPTLEVAYFHHAYNRVAFKILYCMMAYQECAVAP